MWVSLGFSLQICQTKSRCLFQNPRKKQPLWSNNTPPKREWKREGNRDKKGDSVGRQGIRLSDPLLDWSGRRQLAQHMALKHHTVRRDGSTQLSTQASTPTLISLLAFQSRPEIPVGNRASHIPTSQHPGSPRLSRCWNVCMYCSVLCSVLKQVRCLHRQLLSVKVT